MKDVFKFIEMVDEQKKGNLSKEEEKKLNKWTDGIEKRILNYKR